MVSSDNRNICDLLRFRCLILIVICKPTGTYEVSCCFTKIKIRNWFQVSRPGAGRNKFFKVMTNVYIAYPWPNTVLCMLHELFRWILKMVLEFPCSALPHLTSEESWARKLNSTKTVSTRELLASWASQFFYLSMSVSSFVSSHGSLRPLAWDITPRHCRNPEHSTHFEMPLGNEQTKINNKGCLAVMDRPRSVSIKHLSFKSLGVIMLYLDIHVIEKNSSYTPNFHQLF